MNSNFVAQSAGPEFPEDDARPFRREFGDFEATSMPEMPAGFIDESWHNEPCPHFTNYDKLICVYVDYPDPAMREFPECPRFTVHRVNADGLTLEGDDAVLIQTDDWAAALAVLNAN